MKCPFDPKIHCMYLEDAKNHDFLLHPDCPDCPHYKEETLDPPQYDGWKAYAIAIGGMIGLTCFLLAFIYVIKTYIFP
jgi:hypothetical protein